MDDVALARRRQRNLFQEPQYFEFITGLAGTGKTTLVQNRRAERRDVEVCATTGIAAMNLGEALTVHSLLGFYGIDRLREARATGQLQRRLSALRSSGISELVIDEVSMLDADELDVIVDAFDRFNEDDHVLKLTLTGDFCQLPPIDGRLAFLSSCWRETFDPNTTLLTQVHRHADPEFKNALNAARRGDAGSEGTTVFARNADVDRFNAQRLSHLGGKEEAFETKRGGSQTRDWVRTIPDRLVLRPGARVMVLRNRRVKGAKEFEVVNGDTGTVSYRSGVDVVVSLDRGEVVQVRPRRDENLRLIEDPERQERMARNYDPKLKSGFANDNEDRSTWWYESIGWIEYMPLRLAWASTVHKTQGLTLDSVQIDVTHTSFGRTPGRLYVALSRARSAEGLRIVGSERQFVEACRADPKLKAWF